MKDYTQEELEMGPVTNISTEKAIEFCLKKLYEDKVYTVGEEIVKGLTFEELIGVLLMAKDALAAFESMEQARSDRATFARMLPISPLSQ